MIGLCLDGSFVSPSAGTRKAINALLEFVGTLDVDKTARMVMRPGETGV
ncbi:MAG: hypothetical protein ACM3VT_15570 [Solirubrobacterales bacterium]